MQNFIRFTKVSAPGTFLGAAQKIQNGDPKWAILEHGGLKKTSVPSCLRFAAAAKKQIINGMVLFLCAAHLQNFGNAILIYGPSLGIVAADFRSTWDTLQELCQNGYRHQILHENLHI